MKRVMSQTKRVMSLNESWHSEMNSWCSQMKSRGIFKCLSRASDETSHVSHETSHVSNDTGHVSNGRSHVSNEMIQHFFFMKLMYTQSLVVLTLMSVTHECDTYILQKRPIILWSLLIVATLYHTHL